MKYRLSLTLAFCLGATAVACGDDSDDSMETPDASTDDTSGDDTTDDTSDDTTDDTSDDTTDDTSDDTTDDTSDDTTDDTSDEDAGESNFSISSPNFEDGEALPDSYTCEGKPFGDGHSPELNWSGAPEGTLSYALVFKDTTLLPDAPQYGYHWAAWNIPVSVEGIPEHLSTGITPPELEGGIQHRNQADHDVEFFGPCPSWANFCFGDPRSNDDYSFTLYAFDVEKVGLGEQEELPASPLYLSVLDEYFAANAIAVTELTATSDAAPSSADPICPATVGDGGVGDGGAADASTESDSGVSTDDAGAPTEDSGTSTSSDAGSSDAGPSSDAGSADAG